ncbi:sugar phosphate isomerase/epimerase family protein [Halorussus salinisoli]|uniref:sugar phosphate isomerase/epimerase family protein n=1 Tax=Halorussus salinisoli TaxID=2558242 RepID=UPI0010C1885F|nr:sugar phosphate isomerase/epimerase family protein [Halorussus salinisoli]
MVSPRENHGFTLSGFADEIGPDLKTQLDVLEEVGVSHLDLRGIEETNVLDLSSDQVERIQRALDVQDVGVTSIGSPIGKIDVTDDFEPHLERFDTAIERAKQFDAEYIRLFSYYIPENDDPSEHREEVMRRMKVKTERAAEAGVTLVHENEKDIYGDTPERCRDILTTIDSPHLRAAFDPANFLEIGIEPYPDAFVQLVEYVEQLHVKDAIKGERGEIRPAGDGDGDFPAILDALAERGFVGPTSLEPHLDYAGPMTGRSGPEGYQLAADGLIDCLDRVEATYE